jgi:hypothetical protein
MEADKEAAMSTQVTGPVVAYIDRSTPTGCIAFAAAEAERRACGLVVVTLGARLFRPGGSWTAFAPPTPVCQRSPTPRGRFDRTPSLW